MTPGVGGCQSKRTAVNGVEAGGETNTRRKGKKSPEEETVVTHQRKMSLLSSFVDGRNFVAMQKHSGK